MPLATERGSVEDVRRSNDAEQDWRRSMGHEVKVGRRDETLVMTRRLALRPSEGPELLPAAFASAYAHLERIGSATGGPPFVIYNGTPHGDDPYDADLCVPVASTIAPAEGWRVEALPAGTFATLVHVGSYDSLEETYAAVKAWIREHGFEVAGAPREVYLSDAETPPEETRTIVEFPVTEAAALVTSSAAG
jgi:effector-binding domain-containing protein